MVRINDNYLKLPGAYLFSEIKKRVTAYGQANPGARIISMGIGDISRALPPSVIKAMHAAVEEMAHDETFRGYPPEQGYEFLRQAIVDTDYRPRGVDLSIDEVFISDGAKCDTANFQELFSPDCIVAIADPVYPVYLDTNVMAGRAGDLQPDGRYSRVIYLPCTEANSLKPPLPPKPAQLIYLCSPNNPTGVALTRADLSRWVEYAREHGAVILYDSAYERYIRDEDVPHTIYEVPGAKDVAVEFRSYSKTAGFTGTRCAYSVVPKELMGATADGKPYPLGALWLRRQSTKFNGVSYPVQVAAAATHTEDGRRECDALVQSYMENARIIREALTAVGLKAYGGVNAPYIWAKTPDGVSSMQFFDRMLTEANVVVTPGVGFGPSGEGFVRLTAFASREATEEAMERVRTRLRA
jgi:LL-diaminopimelate aminotransferase